MTLAAFAAHIYRQFFPRAEGFMDHWSRRYFEIEERHLDGTPIVAIENAHKQLREDMYVLRYLLMFNDK
jgi:hypothetical protein